MAPLVPFHALTVAALLLGLVPSVAAAQTPDPAGPRLDRFSLQVGAGLLLRSGGQSLSAAFGFSPVSKIDVLVSVERDHQPFRREAFSHGYGLRRGGTLTAISGEVRVSLRPPHRVSPYGLAGIGGGVSKPTVNSEFPNPVTNALRVAYFGAGVRVPMAGGITMFGDARAMMALEGNDSVMGIWPVRAGLAWRF